MCRILAGFGCHPAFADAPAPPSSCGKSCRQPCLPALPSLSMAGAVSCCARLAPKSDAASWSVPPRASPIPGNSPSGDRSWIGDHAELYSLGAITIGSDSVVSQRCYICAATHDHRRADFAILAKPVTIGDQVWVATDVFVAPGVTIGDGAVIAPAAVFSRISAPAKSPRVRLPGLPQGATPEEAGVSPGRGSSDAAE